MYTIIHNSRCGKSRDAIKILEDAQVEFKVREYLKEELNIEELISILNHLQLKPIDIVRTNEQIWKDNFKGKYITDDELIDILIKNPKLIQRPIVLDEHSGVVGRPVEKIEIFLKK